LTKKAPYKGLGADSEEKHEPVSDIDTAVVGSLKALDPKRPIREADFAHNNAHGSASDAKQLLRMLVLIPIKGFIGTNQNRILAS
jgi:hypothetical protein